MPTIHVSENVWEKINKRRKGDEPPTDVIERLFEDNMERINQIVEDKIYELVVEEALE